MNARSPIVLALVFAAATVASRMASSAEPAPPAAEPSPSTPDPKSESDAPDPLAPYPPKPPSMTPPDTSYTYAEPRLRPTLPWLLAQLVPSPSLGFGHATHTDVFGASEQRVDVSFGFRWQVTPVLWSWGVHRGLSPWRFLVVDPVARFSGSLETTFALDYFLGYVDRLIVRPGIAANFPLVQRGEYLSMSLGTSAYVYDGIPRVAYDVGAYTLFGLFGVQFTVAPSHDTLRAMTTFRIRYF